jgi:hypothetical protein
MLGADKVLTGTPDLFIPLPDGTYIFAEQTTTDKAKVPAKILDDLDKCLDEPKTGIPATKIREFIACHTSVLDSADEHSLIEAGRVRGVLVTLLGIGPIAHDLATARYASIARDYLNIEIDTGQIVPVEEFVTAYGQNALATPLDTQLLHRDSKLKAASDALETHDILIFSGPPGVGKSRLAVEVARRAQAAKHTLHVRAIRDRGANLFEDLRVHFAPPGEYLILVDDANRVGGFDYILQLLHEDRTNRRISIIATTRDYAIDRVNELTRPYGGGTTIHVDPLKDEQIGDIVRTNFNIRNSDYIERITTIARGNPRLAIMAGRVAIREQNLASLANVETLYDEYFRSIRGDLSHLTDPEVLRAAGIVALFRHVDRRNEKQIATIADVFNVDPERFWSAVEKLHDAEVVDLYENEIVKVADQVMSTFLFYRALFRDRALDPALLLHSSIFPQYGSRVVDAINPVVDTFDAQLVADKLRAVLQRRLDQLDDAKDATTMQELLRTFGGLLQTESLTFVRDQIALITPEPLPPLKEINFRSGTDRSHSGSSLWSLLAPFRGARVDTATIALNLASDLLAGLPRQTPNALSLFAETYGLRHDSHRRDYEIQHATIDVLWSRAQSNAATAGLFARVFLKTAEHIVRTEHRSHQMKSDLALSVYTWTAPQSPEVRALREKVWSRVAQLLGEPHTREAALAFIRQYAQRSPHVSDPVHIANDAKIIIPALDRQLDPAQPQHAALVNLYIQFLASHDVALTDAAMALRDRFSSGTSRLARVLLEEFPRRRIDNWEQMEREREERLAAIVNEYCDADMRHLVQDCIGAVEYLPPPDAHGSRNDWFFRTHVASIWSIMARRGQASLIAWTRAYLDAGNPLALGPLAPSSIVGRIVHELGPDTALELLSAPDYSLKSAWLGALLAVIPKHQVTRQHLDALYKHFESAPPEAFLRDMRFLANYEHLDPRVMQRVARILVHRSESDIHAAYPLLAGMDGYQDHGKRIRELFGGSAEDVALLKRAYLAAARCDRHVDYGAHTFNVILDFDAGFGVEWVDFVFDTSKGSLVTDRDDYREYQSLWLRSDHATIMRSMLDRVRVRGEKNYGFYSLAGAYVQTKDSPKDDPDVAKVRANQDATLIQWIRDAADDRDQLVFIFGIAKAFSPDRLRELVRVMLEINKNVEDFKTLHFEPTLIISRSSEVADIQKRIDFYESLIPLFTGVELLDHRTLVENTIAALRKDLEEEKRRDFLGV